MQEFTGDDLADLLGESGESKLVSDIDDLDSMLAGAESLPETGGESSATSSRPRDQSSARWRSESAPGQTRSPQSARSGRSDVERREGGVPRRGVPQERTAGSPGEQRHGESASSSAEETRGDDESLRLTAAYLKALDSARARLRKLQKPREESADRNLQRLESRLESLTVQDVAEVVAVIEKIGQTGQIAALQPISDWAGCQNRHIALACARAAASIDSCRAGLILLSFIGKKNVEAEKAAVAGLLRRQSGVILQELLQMASFRREWLAVLGRAASELPEEEQGPLLLRLKRMWKSDDPLIVSLSVAIAARMEHGPALEDFARLMKRPDPMIRVAALQGMGQAGEKKAVRLVNAAMSDPDSAVRAQAASNLQGMQSTRSFELLLKGVVDPDVQVRRNSATALVHSTASERIDALVDVIREETDVEVIGALLLVVGRQAGPASLRLIEQYLNSDSEVLRKQSARALRKTTATAAAPLFLKMLKSRDSLQRRIAIEGLGRLKHAPAQKQLCALLSEDPETECRAAAAKALGQLGDSEALPALEEAAGDADMVRCQAVIAIGHLKEPSAIPFLAAQLKLASPEVKYHCCSALAELNAVRSAHLIRELLLDPDPMVKRGARAALERMGLRAAGPSVFRRMGVFVHATLAAIAPGGFDFSGRNLAISAGGIAVVAAAVAAFLFLSGSGGSGGPIPIGSVRDIAVSSDGMQVSVLRSFGVVELWDASTQKLLHRARNPNPQLNRIFFSGASVAMLSGSTGALWDAQSDPNCERPQSLPVSTQVEFIGRAGRSGPVYLFDRGGQAVVFNVSSGQQVRTVQTPFRGGSAVAISADGSTMVTCDRKGNIVLAGLDDGKVREELRVALLPHAQDHDYASSAALSADGTVVAIGLKSGPVVVLDTAARQLVAQLQQDAKIACKRLDFDVRGGLIVFDGVGGITTYDKNFQKQMTARSELRSPQRYSASADRNIFAYFQEDSNKFYVMNLDNEAATVVEPGR